MFTKIPLFLVTFDALGTLYKFREPVAVQYSKVARSCGLNAKVDLKKLDHAFRSSFKHHNASYPNYGKGKLDNPEEWWNLVVKQAFGQVVGGGESALPPTLGTALYKHFSSGAAYELFSDVRPFLQSMTAIKRRAVDPGGPIVLTGVVTNSDPRVEVVLRDLGLHVGPSKVPGFSDIGPKVRGRGPGAPESMFWDYYKIENDFDFISTSYHADAEKPEAGIWNTAEILCAPTVLSRVEQNVGPMENTIKGLFKKLSAAHYTTSSNECVRIHIGDEYSKDYLGARDAGWEGILLARKGVDTDTLGDHDVKVIESLDELAMIVNVMANEFFDQYGHSATSR